MFNIKLCYYHIWHLNVQLKIKIYFMVNDLIRKLYNNIIKELDELEDYVTNI